MSKNEETLVAKIDQINKRLDEIKEEQIYLKKLVEINNKTLMKRINDLQDYNEISDMRCRVFQEQINKTAFILKSINEKLY